MIIGRGLSQLALLSSFAQDYRDARVDKHGYPTESYNILGKPLLSVIPMCLVFNAFIGIVNFRTFSLNL